MYKPTILLSNLLLLITDIRYGIWHTISRKMRFKRPTPQKLGKPNWEHSEIGAKDPRFLWPPPHKNYDSCYVQYCLNPPLPSTKGFLSRKTLFLRVYEMAATLRGHLLSPSRHYYRSALIFPNFFYGDIWAIGRVCLDRRVIRGYSVVTPFDLFPFTLRIKP